ncbi:MAG: FtsX-like permease family protein, partial [Anaerolineae bacterium]
EDLTATMSSDFVQEQEWLGYIQGFTWAVSLLAVLIGGVGVMNTMLMTVFERTREFGVFRAIGWRRRRLLAAVLIESLLLNGLGGLLGIGLGVAAVLAVERLPAVSGFLSGGFPPVLLAQSLGVALVLGLVSGAFPAWQASQLQPAEAMRAEGGTTGHAIRLRFGGTPVRNLLRQPTRTLLTLAGIGIAIMAMVTLRALADGLMEEVTDMVGGGTGNLVGMQADASIDLSTIDEGVVERIAALPSVAHAEGLLTGYTTAGDLPFFVVYGYHPRKRAIRKFQIVEGESLATHRQIILGRVAAENLGKEVGDRVRLFDTSFRVVGIYETGVAFQDGGGVVALRDAQRLFGQPHKVSFLGIWPEKLDEAELLERRIEARFPEVAISKSSEFAEDVGDLQMTRAGTWAIAFLALVVGGAGMTNTMIMSVFERTREIGVLRAVGWRRGRVLWMILRESMALGSIGGVMGLAAGLAASVLLNASPVMAGFVQARFSLGLFTQALVTALVLGAIGGLYPAWWASNLQPVEALRYE